MEELQEELEYAEQMFHDLSVHNNALTTELNEAKHLLVKAGALEFPDVLPVHIFCEVRAWWEGRCHPHSTSLPVPRSVHTLSSI